MILGAGTDWEDPEDPTVIAENELLGAASSIDAAAKKLANLRPRISSTKVSGLELPTCLLSETTCYFASHFGVALPQRSPAVRYV